MLLSLLFCAIEGFRCFGQDQLKAGSESVDQRISEGIAQAPADRLIF